MEGKRKSWWSKYKWTKISSWHCSSSISKFSNLRMKMISWIPSLRVTLMMMKKMLMEMKD